MPEMSEETLLSIVDGEFETAMGAEGGEISTERAKAWDYYLSKQLGNETEGLSQVVTSDVAEVVDGIMPSLLRIFTTADNLVSFDPVSAEDTEAANQESDYVNYVFFKQNPAFMIMFIWFFDALVQKNGIVKAWRDDSEDVSQETHTGLDEDEMLDIVADDDVEVVSRDERTDETVADDGMTVVERTVFDITIRRVSKKGRVRVENVPPEEYRISADARSLDPSAARMVGHERDDVTRSELLAMGFDEDDVARIPSGGDVRKGGEDTARRNKSDETGDAPRDASQEKVRLREAYIRVDFDGDGRSELRQVFVAGNTILSNEVVDRSPFHVICPHPLPHKHFGRSTAEKVMDVQDVSSTLTRQILDNLYHSNNPGHAVWELGMGDDTLDDLMTTRIGRIARFARPVSESYAPMTVPYTAGATFPMLAHWDKVKRDRTGIGSDGEGLSPEALKNIQQSVLASSVDMSKMKIEAIARIFAETGIKSLFRHIHELLQKHQDKAQVVRLRNKWVEVDPQQWRTREDMTVNIGLGIGTREQNLLHLSAIWEKQKDIGAAGGLGVVLSPKNVFNTAAEIVKNANLKDPEMFFMDPGDAEFNPQDQQSELIQMQAQLQAREQELEAAKLQLKTQDVLFRHQREVAKIEQDERKQEDDVTLRIEELRNELTELELKYGRDVPGAGV
ncbi:MAG: hypothetical protein RIB80_04660 [Rhodospirillales bacterium]